MNNMRTLEDWRELAEFVCPVGRSPPDCDGKLCIRRPDPCERCKVKYQLKGARREEGEESIYYYGKTEWKFVSITEDTFKEITEPCQNCEIKMGQMEEPTYYEMCMQARGARVKLWQIHQGNMEVWNNGLW